MESDSIDLRRYARTGDADAFARLVNAYAGMVFTTARRITGDTHLAEDATQNAFLALARDAGQVRTNVVGWLHRTATHRALDVVRARRRAGQRDRAAARDEATNDPRTEHDWAELLPEIDRAIAALPADLRLPLVLHFLQSQSQAQVAAELGVDASTVSRRIDRAVESLRATLRRQGVAAPAALPAVLGQCGPQAIPASLHPALVKIGLSGVGAGRTATLSAKLLSAVAAGFVLVGVAAWIISGTASRRILAVAPPATAAAVMPAAPPATAPTTGPAVAPPAIDLINAVMDAERWVEDVQSLSIESEAVWHNNAEAIAAQAAELKKQFPNLPITPEKFPELRPGDLTSRFHTAFDGRRVRKHYASPTRGDANFAVWDGNRSYGRSIYTEPKQDGIGIGPTVDQTFDSPFAYLHWPVRRHRFWFSPPPEGTAEEQAFDRLYVDVTKSLWPEAAVRGPVYYRGKWCWVVLFREQGYARWYVGMDDYRLYGQTDGYAIDHDTDPRVAAAYAGAAAARGGKVTTRKGFYEWAEVWNKSVPKHPDGRYQFEGQAAYDRLQGDVNINLGLIDAPFRDEKWYADYREVAPGRWMPFEQGWISRTAGDSGGI